MAINPDIRDQAYQFFVEEAPELLQAIEAGLLTLHQERSTTQIHNIMRSAHSIKGGAASVGLEPIAALAHRLENIFKALYSDSLELNIELEDQLLRAYDCLRLPLMEQIAVGSFDADQALATAEPIFNQLEAYCGDALLQTESYIPSSADLGVDMITSIFEVDVAQGLDRLAAVVVEPQAYEVAGELRAQVEVFAGFAELLNLPEFGAIAGTVQQALDTHPDRALEITQLALSEFEACRQAVLSGNRNSINAPSAALLTLVTEMSSAVQMSPTAQMPLAVEMPIIEEPTDSLTAAAGDSAALEDAFSLFADLENIFGGEIAPDLAADAIDELTHLNETLAESLDHSPDLINATAIDSIYTAELDVVNLTDIELIPETIDAEWVENSIESGVESEVGRAIPLQPTSAIQLSQPTQLAYTGSQPNRKPNPLRSVETPAANLTVRVDSARLEKMNNLVGELAINRDALSLQNDQMQNVVRELLNRFGRFQNMVGELRELSDQMLVAQERYGYSTAPAIATSKERSDAFSTVSYRPVSSNSMTAEFDSLEMDRYGALHPQLQEILENLVQLEETVDDISLFARQSNQMLDQQRNRLGQLQDELIWARMLPLGEVLNRFPRMLRDLSSTYSKPVQLKLTGAGVLVEKAILEKLYDPLLHLIRNAFDHGIEPISLRRSREKPEQGQIEICGYHKGNQTVIEIKDDGQGLNLDKIRQRVLQLGWLAPEQVAVLSPAHLFEFIFEPGFSTADRVSELSGRGVGLDVVRSQLRAVKGTVSVTSVPEKGTTFTLYLPLTLTITKLIICLVGSSAIALPADGVEEILTPQAEQTKQSGTQKFLYWREQIIPCHRLGDLLDYACPQPDLPPSKALVTVPNPQNWELPVLILRQEQQLFALEVDRLVTEQELVVKPFGAAIAPPRYTYGCTILGDGSLVPVVDGAALLTFGLEQSKATATLSHTDAPTPIVRTVQAPTILVVDDAVTLRRTLALSLERAGFRVLQARDGREAIAQLQKSPAIRLVVCDVEMPNMNGFEFLSYRRQDDQLSQVPVVMLTSRSNEKHRWLALQLGATAYFTKPYLEQEFLATLEQILG